MHQSITRQYSKGLGTLPVYQICMSVFALGNVPGQHDSRPGSLGNSKGDRRCRDPQIRSGICLFIPCAMQHSAHVYTASLIRPKVPEGVAVCLTCLWSQVGSTRSHWPLASVSCPHASLTHGLQPQTQTCITHSSGNSSGNRYTSVSALPSCFTDTRPSTTNTNLQGHDTQQAQHVQPQHVQQGRLRGITQQTHQHAQHVPFATAMLLLCNAWHHCCGKFIMALF